MGPRSSPERENTHKPCKVSRGRRPGQAIGPAAGGYPLPASALQRMETETLESWGYRMT